ncbi:MAG: redox-regulated ATPase YchF [Chloroflexi bacterium RBG_16_64_43]|nr:MAG: redox-regulated ATPase YchF [Chloroflexi bacterium RBG_16_64_43]
MRLGILGLPQSGKTTIFNALTRGHAPTGSMIGGGRFEVHTGVVSVPDPRVEKLATLFKPHKTVYAQVTYADIAGLEAGSSKGELSGSLLAELRQMDGLLLVVRCFAEDAVPHPAGGVDPLRDLSAMQAELLLNDQISVERKIERLRDELRKGGSRDKAQATRELEFFDRLNTALAAEQPLRDLDLSPDEGRALSGFGLLTQKPLLVVWNLGEGQPPPEIPDATPHVAFVGLQGKIEMEIAQLPAEEAQVFLGEYGISEPSLNRVIRLSYDLLGLLSFFTVGEDEVRAWTVRRGALAPEAAGEIHTDMLKGFIRAEVVHYDDLTALGGMAEARAKGKLRLEGKDYPVKDGDILTIRFNL